MPASSTLLSRNSVTMHLPLVVAGFADFCSSKGHATNVGVMFRGKDNALQPNWRHMPIGYNGRANRRGQRHQCAAPARPAEVAECGRAILRSVQVARF